MHSPDQTSAKRSIVPGAARRYAPPARRWQFAAGLRPSADGSAVRTSLVAGGGKTAGSQRAYSLGRQLCRGMGQTDRRIAVSLNAPPPLRAGAKNLHRAMVEYRLNSWHRHHPHQRQQRHSSSTVGIWVHYFCNLSNMGDRVRN